MDPSVTVQLWPDDGVIRPANIHMCRRREPADFAELRVQLYTCVATSAVHIVRDCLIQNASSLRADDTKVE